jgi:hypothetical protein
VKSTANAAGERSVTRLLRGLPGHPLHPPLNDATIGGGDGLHDAGDLARPAPGPRSTTRRGRRDGPGGAPVPTSVVALHGIAAATTLVLVFLANIGVGGD